MTRLQWIVPGILLFFAAAITLQGGSKAISRNGFSGSPYTVGSIVTASTTVPEAEEVVVSDPNSSQNLVAAITDFSLRGPNAGTNKISVSNNAGVTWSDKFIPLSSVFPITSDGVTWQENRDPALAIDTQQNVYMAGIYELLSGGQGTVNPAAGIYVCQATLPAVALISANCRPVFAFTARTNNPNSEDKASIATDNSSSEFAGNVYVAWVHFTGCTKAFKCASKFVAFSRSADHGVTWTAPLQVSLPGANVQWPQIVVGSDGTIYVAYETVLTSGNGQHYLTISSDGGVSFTTPQVTSPIYQELRFSSTYRKNNAPNIVVSPVVGAEYVYDVFAVQGHGTSSNIVFARSKLPKGAGGFTSPVQMNDSATGQRFLPTAAVDGIGTLHVAWLDTRNSLTVSKYDVYATYSKTLGATFAPNQRVTPALINAGNAAFIGDYMGIAAGPTAGIAHPVWSTTTLQTTTLTVP